MSSFLKIVLVIIFFVLLAGCTSSEPEEFVTVLTRVVEVEVTRIVEIEVTQQVEVETEVTRVVEVVVTPEGVLVARPVITGTVELDGYTMEVLSVVDPAEVESTYSDDVGDGNKLVAVEFVLGNNSNEEAFSTNPINAVLIDDKGFSYTKAEPKWAAIDEMEFLILSPGEKVLGWILFEVPEETIPTRLKFSVGGSGRDEFLQIDFE